MKKFMITAAIACALATAAHAETRQFDLVCSGQAKDFRQPTATDTSTSTPWRSHFTVDMDASVIMTTRGSQSLTISPTEIAFSYDDIPLTLTRTNLYLSGRKDFVSYSAFCTMQPATQTVSRAF